MPRNGSNLTPIVIFGTGEIAQLADFYFAHDSSHQVVGFTVDEAYLTHAEFCGRPVVPFEHVEEMFPPGEYGLFVALSYAKINASGRRKCAADEGLSTRLLCEQSGHDVPRIHARPELLHPGGQHDPADRPHWRQRHAMERELYRPPLGHRGQRLRRFARVVSGGVRRGEGSFVGVNVTIRDHFHIGRMSVLGARALVLDDESELAVAPPRGSERRVAVRVSAFWNRRYAGAVWDG